MSEKFQLTYLKVYSTHMRRTLQRSLICCTLTTSFLFGLQHSMLAQIQTSLLPSYTVVTENFVNEQNRQIAALLLQKNYTAAALTAEFAIEHGESVLGENHPSIVTSCHHLFAAYRALKQYDKAESVLLHSIHSTETALGQDHLNLLSNLTDLAALYVEQQQYAKAEPLYLRELSILEKSVGQDHPSAIVVLEKLVQVYTALGDSENAHQFSQQVNILRQKFGTSFHSTNSFPGLSFERMDPVKRSRILFLLESNYYCVYFSSQK